MTSAKQPLVWLITGASSGFGRCLVDSALARGDLVIATARNLAKMKSLQATDQVRIVQLDVDSGIDVIQARIKEAIGFWGRIDVLVNNAGFVVNALFEEAGSEMFKKQYQTNVFGLIDVTTAMLPYMRERRSGTIVMIGSRLSWSPELPCGGLSPYAPSKAAVRVFSEALAVELEPFSIRVLIVEPGAFLTEGIPGPNHPIYSGNCIAEYDSIREQCQKAFVAFNRNATGDPAKGMDAIVEVVREEGAAEGKGWPLYLPLGSSAYEGVRTKCNKMLETLDNWKDVILGDYNFSG